jgi:putative DNA primase/helicase
MNNIIELVPEAASSKLARPCYRVYDHGTTLDGKKLRPGVWFHGTKRAGALFDAIKRDDEGNDDEGNGADYGRLLRFRNLDGRWLTWAMPGELLAGRSEAILAVLLNRGLKIAHRTRARVVTYIANQEPKQRITAATATGWHGPELFITPTDNIGKGEAIYQTESAADGDYGRAGTLDGWREGIGALLPGNPILQLAVGTALAGPLLYHLGIHSGGGFHLLWDSSNGKTTAVECAASVWGHGSHFTLKWNATANGLEGIAAIRNDCLLALDELGQADPRYVGDVVYSVADGIGKQRASRSSAARRARRWRVMLLSSGEVTLETKMSEAGKRVRAGQEVRLVTVSAGRTFGAWDNLHDHRNGASLSDALKRASTTHYGHAGPEFVRQLIASGDLGNLPAMLEAIKAHFPAQSGQPARVAERFAIVALALELAVGVGLLPMLNGEGTASMVGLFEAWSAGHGEGPSEDRQILKAIADFLDRHGGSRFQSVKNGAVEVRDRAGYWESTKTGRLYLFTRGGLEEATKGFELTRVVRALDSVGAITKRDRGRAQASKRLPDGSKPKLYFIDPDRLEPDG